MSIDRPVRPASPPACGPHLRVTAGTVPGFGVRLRHSTARMDVIGFLAEVWNQFRLHYPEFLRGYRATVILTIVSMALALLVGALVALLRTSEFPPARWATGVYTEFFRNTPLLVQLIFWFFALPKLPHFTMPLFGEVDWLLSPWQAAIIGLTLYTGAYCAEAIRSGLISIDKGQTEAARAIGLTYTQTRLYVVFPQAMRVALPLLTSILSALVRNSALVSAVGVKELLGASDAIQQQNFLTFEVFTVTLVLYLSLTLPLAYASGHLERWVAPPR